MKTTKTWTNQDTRLFSTRLSYRKYIKQWNENGAFWSLWKEHRGAMAGPKGFLP